MAPRRVKVNKLDYKKLNANDVVCPICRSILIKPVTLPCTHGFCFTCFETTQNSSVCPLCRVRVGSWLRSATKSNKLVNETLWEAIQISFPLQVRNKLNTINENSGAKHKRTSEENQNKIGSSVKSSEKVNTNSKKNEAHLSAGNPSASSSPVAQKKTRCKSNKVISLNLGKTETRLNSFLNNFATKEYTCRILCQSEHSKDKKLFKESQMIVQKKNKRIQEISQLEKSNDRSNSIESECLYFKPIDYRHNPPSEGLPPIKVPSRKPNVTTNIKILAPSGQNQISMNHLESAFARLCSPLTSSEKEDTHTKENLSSQVEKNNSTLSTKRKLGKFECEIKARKKLKTNSPSENQTLRSRECSNKMSTACDISKCRVSATTADVQTCTNIKQTDQTLTEAELIKRSLQEKADFELATKLQQTFNQSYKYSTRSTVLKKMATKNQVKVDEFMTPYKVK